MNYEYKRIQKALKDLMKSKRATYQSVAHTLEVSPATVKRRLNGEDMTFQQLKEFAQALSVSFYELIELSKKLKREPHFFTFEQEKILSSNIRNMHVFRLILAGQNYSQIKIQMKMTDKDLQKTGMAFEKVGLAQLLPGNRFVTLVRFPFRWQKEGPLTKEYGEMILKNVLNRIRHNKGSAQLSKHFELALSPEAYQQFCNEIHLVYSKYQNISEIHLSSQIHLSQVVSGVLFADQFSVWDMPEVP